MARVTDKGWRADFDWLVKNDTNAVRVLEGRYDATRTGDPGGAGRGRKSRDLE